MEKNVLQNVELKVKLASWKLNHLYNFMIDYPGLEKDIKPWTKENITKIGNPALKFLLNIFEYV